VKEIYFDQKTTSLYYFNLFKSLKIKTKFFNDPINYLKSIKNNNEISNLKIAHTFDGIAIVKFLYWLEKNKFKKISELDCQNKIENFKKKNKYYLGPSFETISAFGKNASIVHYNAKDYKTNYLRKNNLYLLDCGSQYFYGTTDMTRTIAIGKQSQRKKLYYTLVLKSHIKVSNFNLKKNTLGKQIDLLARKPLKLKKLDYNHGTGHGVGYLSNVHEHPPSISKYSNTKFYQNQVISNEPGYYKDNQFGIRLENLIFINHNRKFENLTLVPFDNTMIIKNMLSLKEKAWINKYHEDVFEKINKFLTMNERSYLRKLCLKIN
jgi:Xaa-Pro aminopeptidase